MPKITLEFDKDEQEIVIRSLNGPKYASDIFIFKEDFRRFVKHGDFSGEQLDVIGDIQDLIDTNLPDADTN